MNDSFSLADLQRWEDHGATWRAVEMDGESVVLELCTCYGEPVEMARSREQALIEHVRDQLSCR